MPIFDSASGFSGVSGNIEPPASRRSTTSRRWVEGGQGPFGRSLVSYRHVRKAPEKGGGLGNGGDGRAATNTDGDGWVGPSEAVAPFRSSPAGGSAEGGTITASTAMAGYPLLQLVGCNRQGVVRADRRGPQKNPGDEQPPRH